MAELTIGEVFAGCRIESLAGKGGMGFVYRATQLELERPVALKLIAPDLADDPDFRERFKRESRLAASIDHPNVIPVYEAGEDGGRLFITMRFVDGTDLRTLIAERGRLPVDEAVGFVGQVAAALDAAHRRGLVHRDVKPANVLVAHEGSERHAYLTDFGLTKRSAAASGLTRTGQFVGTADYAAPEQIMGKGADARTDVYALGCLLFHALAGVVPFQRDSEVATIYAHISDPPPSLSDAAPGLPAALDAVVQRSLAKEPDDRFPSAGDLARAARAAVRDESPSQPEASIAMGVAAPGGAPGAPTQPPGAPAAPTQPAAADAAPTEAIPSPAARTEGVPTEAGPTDVLQPSARPAARGRPRWIPIAAVGGALAVAALLAVSGVFGGGDDGGGGGENGRGEGPGGGGTPRVIASIPVDGAPDGISVDGDDVWFVDVEGAVLQRIDAGSEELVGEPVSVGANPDSVVAEGDTAWVTNADDGSVTRVETGGDPVAAGTIDVGGKPEGIALGEQLVWVAGGPSGAVHRIDRGSATIVGAPIGAGSDMIDVFVGEETVWASDQGEDALVRIDSSTAELQGDPIPVGSRPRGVVEADGSAWVANSGDGTVTRVDAGSGQVSGRPIRVGDNPRDIAFGEGFIWVANTDSNSITRIDPSTGKVLGQPIAVGSKPANVTVAGGSVWVTNTGDGTVTRIDPSA